jgi:tetratricopeptide (TPR) repeat protein
LAQLEYWFGRVLSGEQATMLVVLNRDLDNHYVAWAWAQQHEPEHFIRATDPMMFVHSLQGRLQEGRQLFQTTLSALQSPQRAEQRRQDSRRDPRSRVAALFADLTDASATDNATGIASNNAKNNNTVKVIESVETADDLLERVHAYLKQALAWFEEHAGRGQVAFEHCRQALSVFRNYDEPFGLMRALTLLADMRLRQGKLELAESLLNEALNLAQDSYPGESSMLLNKLGDLYLVQDDLARAADTYNRSVSATNSEQGSASPIINVNNFRGLGRIALENQQWQAARAYFEQSLTLARTAQFLLREPYILTQLALVYAAPENSEANLEQAWSLLHEAAGIAKTRGQQGSLALTYAVMGNLAARVDAHATVPEDVEPSQYYWLESLRSAWRQRDVSAMLHALLALVRLVPEGVASPNSQEGQEGNEALQQLEPKHSQYDAIVTLICQHSATSPEDRQQAQTLPYVHIKPLALEEAVRYFWPDAPKPTSVPSGA